MKVYSILYEHFIQAESCELLGIFKLEITKLLSLYKNLKIFNEQIVYFVL